MTDATPGARSSCAGPGDRAIHAETRSPAPAVQRSRSTTSASRRRQRDADITGGPSGTVPTGDATFSFAGNQDRMTFSCRLDDEPSEACASPKSYGGLPDGQHTFSVTRGTGGTADPSPAARTWTVRASPTAKATGSSTRADNCPDAANAGQGDADHDGVGDACEVLPSGNTPVEAGKVATVKLISGEVFVKLPAGASGSAFTAGLRVPFQSSGFVSLKGVAAVPMGSTLDTRAGEVAVTAAVNGQRPRAASRSGKRRASARASSRSGRPARRAGEALQADPAARGARQPGRRGAAVRASGPAKGTRVRSLATTAKGVFRTVGGAATATPGEGHAPRSSPRTAATARSPRSAAAAWPWSPRRPESARS